MPYRFPSAWLDELRSRSDLVQIVSGYVQLKKAGHRYWGLCPFHGEKTASFSVDSERQLYYCFGCKAGGDVIHFVMDIERCDFHEAVETLAEQAHLPLPEMERSEEYERIRSERERLLNANRLAARFYHETLYRPEGAAALAYLRKRGLSDSVIRRFGLGAAPDRWSSLTDYLVSQGYSLQELQRVGLSGLKERKDADPGDTRPRQWGYDVFRNRAMFPIIDLHGNVIAFGGRALSKDEERKYLNTSDTPIFNKRLGVYAANLLRKQRHLERVILVEGYMDVIALSQFGVEGVCATLGTALTNEQARLLHRFAPQVFLAYDGDSAGQHAILRGLDIFAAEGIPARVLDFPDGLDPDEFIRRDGIEGFRALPSLSPAAFRLRRLRDQYDLSDPENRITFAREASRIISPLDPVEREVFLKELSVQTGFTREVLLEQVMKEQKDHPPAAAPAAPRKPRVRRDAEPVSEITRAQETLLSLAAMAQIPEDVVNEKDFEDPELKSLYMALASGTPAAALVSQAVDDETRSRYTRILIAQESLSTDQILTMAHECVNRIRKARIESRLQEIMSQLGTLTQEEERRALLAEAQELSAQNQRLSRSSSL